MPFVTIHSPSKICYGKRDNFPVPIQILKYHLLFLLIFYMNIKSQNSNYRRGKKTPPENYQDTDHIWALKLFPKIHSYLAIVNPSLFTLPFSFLINWKLHIFGILLLVPKFILILLIQLSGMYSPCQKPYMQLLKQPNN